MRLRSSDPREDLSEEAQDELFHAEMLGIDVIDRKSLREWLADMGVDVVPNPSDDRLGPELSRLIEHLAFVGVALDSTDHLSDRELYEYLISPEVLDIETAALPDSFIHLDVIGGFSNDDIRIYLTYYASDEDRAEWKKQFRDDELPPRQKPPFDRDRHLPEPGGRRSHYEKPRPE